MKGKIMMIPPNVQITNLKWRFFAIGILSLILWLNTTNLYWTLLCLVVIWLLIIASLGGLSTLRDTVSNRLSYRDKKELK
jgi:uncharacterized membrane protein YqjE